MGEDVFLSAQRAGPITFICVHLWEKLLDDANGVVNFCIEKYATRYCLATLAPWRENSLSLSLGVGARAAENNITTILPFSLLIKGGICG